jgi:hypothetical protein
MTLLVTVIMSVNEHHHYTSAVYFGSRVAVGDVQVDGDSYCSFDVHRLLFRCIDIIVRQLILGRAIAQAYSRRLPARVRALVKL